METKDSRNACLGQLEETRTVLFDSASATAGRRRREARLFRKDLNQCHQGHTGLKHAGSRPTMFGRTLYIIDEARDGGNQHDLNSSAMAKLSGDGEDIADLISHGLVRSRSFPIESRQTRKYIFQISKLKGKNIANGQSYSVNVGSDEQHGRLLRVPSAFSSRAAGSISTVRARAFRPDFNEGNLFFPQMQHHENMRFCATANADLASPLHGEIVEKTPHTEKANSSSPQQPTPTIRGASNTDNHHVSRTTARSVLVVEDKCPLEFGASVNSNLCPPNGKVLVCGRRREMEDTAVVVPSFTKVSFDGGKPTDLHFFGVYDGHGGSQASNYCAQRLHQALAEEMENSQLMGDWGNEREWEKVMTSTFLKVDREVGGVCPFGVCEDVNTFASCCVDSIAPENVGTTALVAVVSSCQIVVANCGDSRAVLSRGGKAIPLSEDHKPERADETSRIEAAGGHIIQWKGFRVGALLALSRSIGDRYLKRYVISQPDVVCLPRTKDDECLILASDGLWDVIDNETACDVARRCLASARRNRERKKASRGEDLASTSIAATLVKLAFGRGSGDNITVLVIDLGV